MSGRAFIRAAGPVTFEVGYYDKGRAFDLELRTDNLQPGGLLAASRTANAVVEEINERLYRLTILERYLREPRLALADRWQITPTLRAAAEVGREIVVCAPLHIGQHQMRELAYSLDPPVRLDAARRIIETPDARIRHVSTYEPAVRGLRADVVVVTSDVVGDLSRRRTDLLQSLAVTTLKAGDPPERMALA